MFFRDYIIILVMIAIFSTYRVTLIGLYKLSLNLPLKLYEVLVLFLEKLRHM